MSDVLPSFMFLGARASDDLPTATTDPMDVAKTHHVAATSGDPTVVVNGWDCSRNGENKQIHWTTAANWNFFVEILSQFWEFSTSNLPPTTMNLRFSSAIMICLFSTSTESTTDHDPNAKM